MNRKPSNRGRPVEATALAGSKPRRYAEGRLCSDCGKRLSSWNKGPLCYACEEERVLNTPRETLVQGMW